MTSYKNKIIAIGLLFFVNIAFAKNEICPKFFVSNNTQQTNLEAAYHRLVGKEQINLQSSVMGFLQKNHIKPVEIQDILGTYLSLNKRITADNTERFKISGCQNLSDEKIFSVARKLAIALNQESVLVFIPSTQKRSNLNNLPGQNKMGDVVLNFTSFQPDIEKTVSMLHTKLPAVYSQTFSLHLVRKYKQFSQVKVTEVEWLGDKANTEEVKKAFPREKVSYHNGRVFLIYKDGR